MTTLNRQLQSTIVKFYTNQALNDFGIEVDTIKKKVNRYYK